MKKEFYLSFFVFGLTILFSGICVAVYLSKGKSAFWISKKMKIGALILSFTVFSSGGCTPMCYDSSEPTEYINLDSIENNTLNIDLSTNNKVTGTISERISNEFSFALGNISSDTIFYQSDIFATDGEFDEITETFALTIPETKNGDFILRFYNTNQNLQADHYPIVEIPIKIVHSRIADVQN
jgi:hypothetical protein